MLVNHPDLPLDLIESKVISWLQMEFARGNYRRWRRDYLVLVGKRSTCLHPSNYDPMPVDGT